MRGGVKNSNNEPMKPRNEPEASVNHRWTPMNRDTARRLNRREQRERRLAAREHKEHERSRIPWVRSGRKTGGDGKRWVGKRAFPTLSGQEIGKWCSFSHLETALTRLFPHNSTQVVDFPRMYDVRLFWGGPEMVSHGWNTDKTRMPEGWIDKEGRNGGKQERKGRRVNHGGKRSLQPMWGG